MTQHSLNDDEVRDRLWREIKDARYGMLGVVGSHEHFQPMTAFLQREDAVLWFFTRKDTDIARTSQDARTEAMFIVQSKDQEFQACIGGRLVQDGSREVVDRYWNPMVAAWFPDGKDDPYLTMLKLECRSAAVWLAEAGRAKYTLEVARANVTGETPNVGEHREVPLGGGGARA